MSGDLILTQKLPPSKKETILSFHISPGSKKKVHISFDNAALSTRNLPKS